MTDKEKEPNRRSVWLGAAGIAAVTAVLLHPALGTGKGLVPADGIFFLPPWKSLPHERISNFLLSDQYLNFIPLRHFFFENVRRGRFPLWNPAISCGVPNIASMQAAFLYPVNLALSWLDPFDAAVWAAFLKLWLAAFFTFLYMRLLKVGRAGALLSGVTFALCGFMIVWLGHPHVNCVCLLPALFYFLELGFSDGRAWAGYAAAYGCMILGGHPPSIVHVNMSVLAYFLFRIFPEKRKGPYAARFLGATAAGILIAAPQLLPFLEYYRISSIAGSAASLKRWAGHLSPASLTQFLLPHIAGTPSAFGQLEGVFGLASAENFNERTGYVGIMPLFLACVALLRRRERWIGFYAAAAGCCLWVIYGLPPAPRLLGALPVLSSMTHTRLLFFLCFTLAVLAGAGLDALEGLEAPQRKALAAGAGVCAVLVLFWLEEVFRPVLPEMTAAEKAFALRQVPLFAGGMAAAVFAALAGRKTWRTPVKAFCLAWTCFELLSLGIGSNPAIARSAYYPSTPAIERLRQDRSLFRIFGMGWTLPPDTGILYGLQDIRGQDFATVRRYEELMTGRSGDFSFYSFAPAPPPPLGWLNTKYVLADRDWKEPAVAGARWKTVYDGEASIRELQPPLDRALLVSRREVAAPADVLARVREASFDPRKVLLLEEDPREIPVIGVGPGEKEPRGSFARVSRYEPDDVTVEAAAPAATSLLLLDTYYPGWKAYVNGREARIYRADYNFRAVLIPAGRSTVRFEYAPWSFRLGLILAACGLVLSACIFRLRIAKIAA
jgi:hypothetical protein